MLISIAVNRLDCGRACEKIDQQMKVNLANGIRHINFGLNLKEDAQIKTINESSN